jgi:hypothetical protein
LSGSNNDFHLRSRILKGRTSRLFGQAKGTDHCEATESGSSGVSAIGASQESHHFVSRSDVGLSHRTGVLQPVPHRLTGIEQLKSNVVVVSPSLQKHKHAQTSAFDGGDFREIEDNDSGIAL